MRSALMGLLLGLVLLAGCAQAPADQAVTMVDAAAGDPGWVRFADGFLKEYFRHDPYYAVYQGRHDFDGKLPDWSDAGLKARSDFLAGAIVRARAFDAGALSPGQRFERDYLVTVARSHLFWLTDADAPHANPLWYIDNGLDPNVYIARPYADAATRMRAFIAFARAVPVAAAQIRANLKYPLPLSFIDAATASYAGLADYYQADARAAFASVGDPALHKQFDAAVGPASKAMRDLAVWFESGRSMASGDFALGADRLSRMLDATEMVDTPLDRIEAVARVDLKRNQDALKAACTVFTPGASIESCMAKMSANKPKEGVVAAARRQLPDLRAFLIEKDIVSIPGTEQAKVEEAPPYNRQNGAYIDVPGPYDKGLPSIYYIAPPDPAWPKAVQDGYVPAEQDLLFTSVHEVWPGHFLNSLHQNRVESAIGRVFWSYAFSEGWAHYSEEMMWDAGLGNGNTEAHIGQLSNALLRDCRMLSAIGLHARGMTEDQSRTMFQTQCYQDEGNARQQAARGTYDPGYLNYTLGKLMIRKLRDDWTRDKGGRRAWKAFHDSFLSYGGPPIPLVRKAMMSGQQGALF